MRHPALLAEPNQNRSRKRFSVQPGPEGNAQINLYELSFIKIHLEFRDRNETLRIRYLKKVDTYMDKAILNEVPLY